MTEPRVLRLGELIVKGPDIRFVPGASALRASGDEAEVGILVRYEEDSPLKEHTTVRFAAQLPGHSPTPVERALRDRPLVHDVEQLWLAQRFPAPAKGTVKGTFEVHAEYSRAPWADASKAERFAFAEKGTFTLTRG